MEQARGHVVSHTHWDREWRYPLWENRLYLCELMDELLEILAENSDYHSFLLDGQSVIIEDYLAVRPEKRAELLAHIQSGRVVIGPFYTLPDLYPISGEAIVRNLLRGSRECRRLGSRLDVAYESFGWGQPSQLPQIYAGFGLDVVIVSKNVDKSRAPDCEFLWEGLDGTTLLATRLGADARANFYMNSVLEIMHGMAYHSPAYAYQMGAMGQFTHQAGETGHTEDYTQRESSARIHPEKVAAAVQKSWNNMDASLLPNDRLLMCGSDSTGAVGEIGEIIAQANAAGLGYTLKHTGLADYVALMRERLDMKQLRLVKGELRDGPSTSLSANALMTRPGLKRLNKQAQRALIETAEPLNIAAALLGKPYEDAFLRRAMDYLLLAHPHDSINGVTQDKTVHDVEYRLNQVLDISGTLAQSACGFILSQVDYSGCAAGDILLAVFNPLPFPRREVCTAFIDTPAEAEVWSFGLEDAAGGERLACHHIARHEATVPVNDRAARPWPNRVDRHEVIFDTGTIPAGGYKLLRACNPVTFDRQTEFWALTRKTDGTELAVSPASMENEHISVKINPNGTLRLTDKATGYVYDDLNHYESTGDVGDYWMYYPPYHNETYTSLGLPADIRLLENTPLQATVAVTTVMALPAHAHRPERYVAGESRRSAETQALPITTCYTLRKSERMVRVRCTVDNTCKDHRLSVVFPTGLETGTARAQGHFCVDERDATPLKDEAGLYYNELCPQPMQNYVAAEEGTAGLAIVQNGMCEYELRNTQDRPLALTLLRAVRNIICTEHRSAGVFPHQQGGQSLGTLVHEYAICPTSGAADRDRLEPLSRGFCLPPLLVQTCPPLHGEGRLPMAYSLYQLGEKLQLTALKKAEDRNSLVLRAYNPDDTAVSEPLTLHCPIKRAWVLDLDENRLEPLPCTGRSLSWQVGPHKISTIEVETEDVAWR